MITSLFSLVKEDIQEDYSIANLRDHLHKSGALRHFNDLYSDYVEDSEKIIPYLIYCYSFDSLFVVSGEDWLATKKSVLEMVGLNPLTCESIIYLERQSVKDAILFLSREIKDWRYEQIITWKESCVILDKIATTMPDTKSKGGSKNIADANKASYELKLKIVDLENQIKKTSKQGERLNEVQGLNIDNLSMESILKSLKN